MNHEWESAVRNRVNRFVQAVEESKEHYDKLGPTNRYKARTPVIRRFKTKHLLNYLQERGVDVEAIRHKFEETDAEFDRFRNNRGDDYVKKLHSELEYLVAKYPRLVCYFMELDPLELEFGNDLAVRDALEIPLIELDGTVDIQEEQLKVEVLDQVLKYKYDDRLRKILDLVEAEGLTIEKPHLPDRFWWRHPSEHERWWESIKEALENQGRVEDSESNSETGILRLLSSKKPLL